MRPTRAEVGAVWFMPLILAALRPAGSGHSSPAHYVNGRWRRPERDGYDSATASRTLLASCRRLHDAAGNEPAGKAMSRSLRLVTLAVIALLTAASPVGAASPG